MTSLLNDASRSHFSRTKITQEILGLKKSRFETLLTQVNHDIESMYQGRTILVIGAGSFISTETLKLLVKVKPRQLLLVDQSENALANTVREIRGMEFGGGQIIIETFLMDAYDDSLYAIFEAFKIEVILNFAAIKHVRSEANIFGLRRMLEVNVGIPIKIAALAEKYAPEARIFIVSTDKAADPSSFMGASKRLMEIAMPNVYSNFSTVRFANVAFSTGSLLESWIHRINDSKPLVVPKDTFRYLVTPEESGQICLIASVAPSGQIYIPNLPSLVPILLEEFLIKFMNILGYNSIKYESFEEAIKFIYNSDMHDVKKPYPYFCSNLDTQGEKEKEIFVGKFEESKKWIQSFDMVIGGQKPVFNVNEFQKFMLNLSIEEQIGKNAIYNYLQLRLKNFSATDSTKKLDGRY